MYMQGRAKILQGELGLACITKKLAFANELDHFQVSPRMIEMMQSINKYCTPNFDAQELSRVVCHRFELKMMYRLSKFSTSYHSF